MAKNELLIRSSCLATREKLPDKILATGKINLPAKSQLLFYLVEVVTPWTAGQKVKKAIVETLEKNSIYDEEYDEEKFEQVLNQINEALGKIVSGGESSWIGNLNAVIGLIDSNKISIAQTGRVSGYLFRKGKISSLAESGSALEAPHPLKTFSDITSGQFADGDRIVIGNRELYNHLSLDHIRRAIEGLSAPEFIFDLSKILRKNKIFSANVLAFEAIDRSIAEAEPLIEIPAVIYLDAQEDGIVKQLNKKYGPKTKELLGKGRHHLAKAAGFLGRSSKTGYEKAKQGWRENYGPKTKELLQKSAPAVARALEAGKKSVAPQIEKLKQDKNFSKLKIKTRNYSHNPNSAFGKVLSTAVDFSLLIKSWLVRKESRKYILLGIIVILIFVGFWKIRTNNTNQDQAKNQQQIALAYDQAKEAYSTAKEDLALGKASDSSGLESALALAKKAESSEANKSDAVKLARQIQSDIDKMNKISRIYSDSSSSFQISGQNFHASQIGSTIYLINSEGKIYSANSGESNAKLIASIGKNSGEPTALASISSGNQIFILTKNNKLYIFDTKTNAASEAVIADAGGSWETANGIAAFSGNLYLLDGQSGNIFKHSKSGTSYSSGSAYINSKKDYVKNAVDISIDGNIYILSSDGTVSKFSKGAKDTSFSLGALPANSKIDQPRKIFTADDTNYIYILDKNKNLIVRFNKSGQFISEYALDGANITDFTVNEKLKKIWLVSDSKVYEADL